jgi:hypothetical protein
MGVRLIHANDEGKSLHTLVSEYQKLLGSVDHAEQILSDIKVLPRQCFQLPADCLKVRYKSGTMSWQDVVAVEGYYKRPLGDGRCRLDIGASQSNAAVLGGLSKMRQQELDKDDKRNEYSFVERGRYFFPFFSRRLLHTCLHEFTGLQHGFLL